LSRRKKQSNVHRVGLIVVGDELLLGDVADSHTTRLARALSALGHELSEVRVLPDNQDAVRTALSEMAGNFSTVLTTGGLGPTSDDVTREAIAAAAGVRLVHSEDAWLAIQNYAGRKLEGSNKQQALVPEGFSYLENNCGTAPGLCGKICNAQVVALPGPPRELEWMVSHHLGRLLGTREEAARLKYVSYSCYGIPESELEDELRRLRSLDAGVLEWHTVARGTHIAVRTPDDAAAAVVREGIKKRFGSERVADGDVALSRLVIDLLTGRGERVALAESCTGGLIATTLTNQSGSSAVVWGGVVAYSNEAKMGLLGVSQDTLDSHGAVSGPVVREMVEGMLAVSHADYAIAVSGIAGPAGGTEEKPVGTVWIAHGMRKTDRSVETSERQYRLHGDRERIRRKATVEALVGLRRLICSG
jgi:nicotinamide-nucleotide amidase